MLCLRAPLRVTCASGPKRPARPKLPKPKPDVQGDVESKPCDLCGGVGLVRCFGCTVPEGFSERDGKRAGFVDVRQFIWFGDIVSEKRCDNCTAKPGSLTCPRCKGKRKLLFRSAAWR